jgi:hypothetical protein
VTAVLLSLAVVFTTLTVASLLVGKMQDMRTSLAIALALSCGIVGGGLAVDAERPDQAFWYDHASSIFPFLPILLLARSWKWLLCAIPGMIARVMMIAFRDDLVNRWPQVSRGPVVAMIAAWLVPWLPARLTRLWKGGPSYAEYVACRSQVANAHDGRDSRRPNPFFIAGIAALLLPPVCAMFALILVESQHLMRTDGGRDILAKTEFVTMAGLLGGLLLCLLGWVRHWRFRNRVMPWLLATLLLLLLVLPVQFGLLWFLSISVNGIFSGGGK